MKLNRKWLNEEFVDLSGVPDREFVETMTIAGQKVETYERLDAELQAMSLSARVVSITRHDELRPHVGLPGRRRRGRARADRHRRAERTRGRPGPRGPAQFLAARRRAHHKGQAARRGLERHALLPEGAGPDRSTTSPMPLRTASGSCEEDCKPGDDINTVIGNDDTVVDFEITNNRPGLLLHPRSGPRGRRRLQSSRCAITTRSCAAATAGEHLRACWKSRSAQPRTCAAATPRGWCANVKIGPVAEVAAPASARQRRPARSTTSSISRTMSCWNTASPCTPLTTAMSAPARSSSAAASRARP